MRRVIMKIFFLLGTALFYAGYSQSGLELKNMPVMFWNIENYFDPFDDPLTNDDEFTAAGYRHWTWSRFLKKRDAIAKTILAAGDYYGEYPVLVGLAEVENAMVLNQLCRQTALSKLDYKVIHRDSPDRRGIDVGLLYREEFFEPLYVSNIEISLPDTSSRTRSLLYIKGVLAGYDTLHLIVSHWPSKIGGEVASMPRRMAVAGKIRTICDSIYVCNKLSNIIVMGDFNDTPGSKPLKYLAGSGESELKLFSPAKYSGEMQGTIKYKGMWERIDHFYISDYLLKKDDPQALQTIFTDRKSFYIFSPAFLLENDPTYYGRRPFRTYLGPRYLGGVSDHLPIILMLRLYVPR